MHHPRPSTVAPIALLGYGTVGSAVDRHLREHGDELAETTGIRLHVVHAPVRDLHKERRYPPEPGVLTTQFDRILDDDVVAVAELMGGVTPTRGYIEALLDSGKRVATANKQLLAQGGHCLLHRVRVGGSVCGAIPLIETLRTGLPPGGCTRISGIVNGTTNFMLTRMEAGASYTEALTEAQDLGFAELDATEDVTGADAAAKMAIIATIAFGDSVTLGDVTFEGIDHVDADDVRAARDRGHALRLVGTASRDAVAVRLVELDATDPLARLDGADNAVALEGPGFRRIVLAGPGAGGEETATAVIADLYELVRC